MSARHATIEPRGAFDLARSIRFLEGWPVTQRLAAESPADSVMRFAFCAEHDWRPVGVRVRQSGGRIGVELTGPGRDVADLPAQVARILSLDIDGTAVAEIADRDPVVARLTAAAPGLRPVCFWTPWEAACWAVLTQRTSMRTAAGVKQRISRELGPAVELDGTRPAVFPSPQTVLDAVALPGVNPVKFGRLQGLAAAALDGVLTADTLRAVPPAEALDILRRLPGIGPFSAGLILIRGAGAPNVFTMSEPRLLAAVRAAYGLPDTTTEDDYRALAERWHPFRSWVSFWLRASTPAPEA